MFSPIGDSLVGNCLNYNFDFTADPLMDCKVAGCGLSLDVMSPNLIALKNQGTWGLDGGEMATINDVTYELFIKNELETMPLSLPEPFLELLRGASLTLLCLLVRRRRSAR